MVKLNQQLPMPESEETKTLKILVDGVRGKVDFQLNADNGLDTKSGTLIALVGTITVFYVSIIESYYCTVALIPLVILAISAYFLLQALRSQKYNSGLIDVYDETKQYRAMSEHELLNQLLSDYQKAFDDNSAILIAKNRDYKSGLSFFLISIFLMVIFKLF